MIRARRLRISLARALSVSFLGLLGIVSVRSVPAQTETPVIDVVRLDLNPLIDAAARDRNRFAVDIPHVVDAGQAGAWDARW